MKPTITAVGEVLCDLLPERQRAGGAAANYAFHAQALGASVNLISRIGDDAHGRFLSAHLASNRLATGGIQIDPQMPTGTAAVLLSDDGVPSFDITPNVAWDRIAATADALAQAGRADAVYFGSLAQRSPNSREAVRALVSATPPGSLRIFDPNLRSPALDQETLRWSIDAANVVKLSEEELCALAPVLGLAGEAHDCLAQLGRSRNLRAATLTRGARGSLLWTPAETAEALGIEAAIQDTVGAGDSYLAALTLGLLFNWPASQVVQRANQIAAFVCTQSGAMPSLPYMLRAPFLSAISS